MIFPTISVLSFSAFVMVVLLAADWLVWGMTFASDFRQPYPVKPQGSAELVEGVLARLIESTETHVPRTEASPCTVTATSTCEYDDGHGFKRVA